MGRGKNWGRQKNQQECKLFRKLIIFSHFVKKVQALDYFIIRIIGTVIFRPKVPTDDPTPLD
ncbi:hypothetical protein EO95_01860 [Methanosarcina sp. 1.H.T.1A.1]|nr:hypothetical protein EO95_01860 [Methanosarcina sp. 1.H.T.1A.1]